MRRLGPETGETLRKIGMLSALGLAFALCITIGAGLGVLLDRWLGTKPWLFFLGFFVGVAAAVVTLLRTVAKFNTD